MSSLTRFQARVNHLDLERREKLLSSRALVDHTSSQP